MKFTIDRLKFLRALTIVNVAVLPKSPTPAFLNFLLEMDADKLIVTASNGELTITSTCPLQEEGKILIANIETGKTLIAAKYLLDIVRSLDSDSVTLEIIDDVIVRISDEKSQFKLNALRSEEYPDLDLTKEGTKLIFAGEDFKKIISQTAFAASTKEVRPILTAINLKTEGQNAEFVATDSYRLAKKTYELPEPIDLVANIPVKTLNEVYKLIDGGNIEIYISDKKVVFSYKNTNLYSRLIIGDFPKINNMFPSSYPYILQVNADRLISAIQRVSLLAVDKENIVKLSVSGDVCNISSKTEQIGSANEVIEEYRYTGDRFEIAFNANYILDAVKAAQSEEVVLSFVGEMSAFKVTSPNDDSLVQIVTPVRSYY